MEKLTVGQEKVHRRILENRHSNGQKSKILTCPSNECNGSGLIKNGDTFEECECGGEQYEEWEERKMEIDRKRQKIHREIEDKKALLKSRRKRFESVCPERFQGKYFDNFDINEENKTAYMTCEKYASNFPDVQQEEKGVGVFIHGPVGVGKTHLGYAILRQVAIEHGYEIMAGSSIEVFSALSPMESDESRRKSKREFKNRELLLFDDIGTHRLSDWVTERIMEIVDYRYKNMKPTIFTSNKSLSQMEELEKQHPGWQPIVDRIAEMTKQVKIAGESKRIE